MNDNIVNTTKENFNLDELQNICDFTFKTLKIKNPIYSITIINNNQIHNLNKKYRKIDKPTDVLSFAFEESDDLKIKEYRNLGEIYISSEKVIEQAKEYGHTVERELNYLTVHGLLHLLGYDHMNEKDKNEMRELEERILKKYDGKQ